MTTLADPMFQLGLVSGVALLALLGIAIAIWALRRERRVDRHYDRPITRGGDMERFYNDGNYQYWHGDGRRW